MLRQTLGLMGLVGGCQAMAVSTRAGCDTSSLNTTVGSYTVQTNDTIFSIAAATDRGACDIARANRMADAEQISAGGALIIPAETCDKDQSTCLIDYTTNYTLPCVLGGPHRYTVVEGDTWARIASKLQASIDVIALRDDAAPSSSNEPAEGDSTKLYQCQPSRCGMEPYMLTYGTYVDVAKEMGCTVGQLMALNAGYTSSDESDPTQGPILTVPTNCTLLAGNYTSVS